MFTKCRASVYVSFLFKPEYVKIPPVRGKMRIPNKQLNRKNSALPVVLFLFAALIGLGVLVYRGARALGGNPIVKSQDDVPRLTVQEAYQAVRDGKAILVDTRSAEQYAAQHAAGAISLPVSNLEANLPALDPKQWYITYCT
jgi:hypothetical protein